MVDLEIADDAKTAGRADDVIAILVEGFDTVAKAGSVKIDPNKRRVFSAAFGWWASITRSSQAVSNLYGTGLGHESSPIVRTVIQHTLVLQWMVETGDDAIDAVAEYGDDNARLLLRTLTNAKWPLPPNFPLTPPPMPASPSRLITKLKNFEELCVAYDARALYVAFRLLSAYSHPTTTSAMAYVDPDTGTLASRAVSVTFGPLIQTAMCLIQAGHIMSPLIQGDLLRDALARAEQRLGTSLGLWTARGAKGS